MANNDPETAGAAGRSDAELALAAAGGDRSALGEIYDRYAPRVHSLAAGQLRDREAAADITQETFLLAAQRLSGLRDPERLGAWLFAVARHQVVDHVRRNRRHVVTDRIEDYDMPAEEAQGFDRIRGEELRVLLADTRSGLDDRDRMVLELAYGRQLAGADIAAALGVREDNAHQLLSRARLRLKASLGALLVARRGRGDCPDLERLLAGWDGVFSTIWRKRVARHIDACTACAALERKVLSPAALGAAFPIVALPAELRARVLSSAFANPSGAGPSGVAPEAGRETWRDDGFPPGGDAELALLAAEPRSRSRGGLALVTGGAVLAVVLAVVAGLAASSNRPGAELITEPQSASAGPTSTGAAESRSTATTTATVEGPVATARRSSPATSAAGGASAEPSPASVRRRLVVRPGGDGGRVVLPAETVVTLAVSHTGPDPVQVTVEAPEALAVTAELSEVLPDESVPVEIRWENAKTMPKEPVPLTFRAEGFPAVRITVVPEPITRAGPRLAASQIAEPLQAPERLSGTFTLTNTGDATAEWAASPQPRGLSVAPATGRLEPGESTAISVTIPASAPPSRAGGRVTVTAAGSPAVLVEVPWVAPG